MPDFEMLQDAATVSLIKRERVRDFHAGRHGSRDDGTRTVRDKKRDTGRNQARKVKQGVVTFIAREDEAA